MGSVGQMQGLYRAEWRSVYRQRQTGPGEKHQDFATVKIIFKILGGAAADRVGIRNDALREDKGRGRIQKGQGRVRQGEIFQISKKVKIGNQGNQVREKNKRITDSIFFERKMIMSVNKMGKIESVNDEPIVKAAQKILMDVEAKFQKAANYPLIDDFAERAKAMLDGTKLQPRKEPDEVELLRAAARMALGRLQEAQRTAAERIVEKVAPDYELVRSELLTECLRFKEALTAHDGFIDQLWRAGLYDYLPASWSKKAAVVQIFPSGRLDLLIENLRL